MIICDIETTPLEEKLLLGQMPEELRNPIMPEEIKNPQFPELADIIPPKTWKDAEKIKAWQEKKLAEMKEKAEATKAEW